MVDIGQVINGKYRVVRLIGDGGMGSVYEAHHEVLGARVALKFLHPELSEEFNLKERFLQEARVSATIQSPHIVRVLDVDVADDLPYLVMDLLIGESLQQLLHRVKHLSVAKTMEYAQQILFGLEAAHSRRIVHRDLKPDNVFITQGPAGELLKILDFGIAKLRHEQGYQLILTQPGAVMGTPEYMAPEQAYSADQVDARSDVYSVGVMLFEMLSGQRPAEGETPQEIAHQILMGQALRLDDIVPELPSGLVRVVHTAIQPRPEDRWEDAAALREALLPFLPSTASTQTGSRPYTAPQTPFAGVKKTPRIDGTRPVAHPAGAGALQSNRSSIDIPIDERSSQVAATIPPEAGPPRASAVPPLSDPGVNERTRSMDAVPDRRSSSPAPTVNIPAVPNAERRAHRGITAVSRSKRRRSGWGWWLAALIAIGGVGGVAGYYLWYASEDSPVPPPLPARRAVPYGASAEPVPSGSDSTVASGPVQIEPHDPEALEEAPVDWQSDNPPKRPATAAPAAAASADPEPTRQAPTAEPAPPPPVFTIPTSITLPFPFPTSIPTTFPTVFTLPGAPPPSST